MRSERFNVERVGCWRSPLLLRSGRNIMRRPAPLLSFLAFAILTAAGCAELGQINTPGDYGNASAAGDGERRHVELLSRKIDIRTDVGRPRSVQDGNQTSAACRQRDY